MDDELYVPSFQDFSRTYEEQESNTAFIYVVRKKAEELDLLGIVDLTKCGLEYVIKKIQTFPYFEYKNPMGLLLGYWVTEDTKTKINKKRLQQIQFHKIELQDFDVIRYAKFWIKMY